MKKSDPVFAMDGLLEVLSFDAYNESGPLQQTIKGHIKGKVRVQITVDHYKLGEFRGRAGDLLIIITQDKPLTPALRHAIFIRLNTKLKTIK